MGLLILFRTGTTLTKMSLVGVVMASHFHQHKPTGAGQWVRLPSGEVIGMREP